MAERFLGFMTSSNNTTEQHAKSHENSASRVKARWIRSGIKFYVSVVLTNVTASIILFYPLVVVLVGIAHLVQLAKGGQPVLNDGPAGVLFGGTVSVVGLIFTAVANVAIARSNGFYRKVKGLLVRASHVLVAVASFVGGSLATSLVIHGRSIYWS